MWAGNVNHGTSQRIEAPNHSEVAVGFVNLRVFCASSKGVETPWMVASNRPCRSFGRATIDMNMDSKVPFNEPFDLKCHVLRKNP